MTLSIQSYMDDHFLLRPMLLVARVGEALMVTINA